MAERPRNPFTYAPGSVPSVLAGRAGEISAFENALALASNRGAASPVIFTGQRGMGKTALLRHCANLAEQRGAVVLRFEATPDERFNEQMKRAFTSARRDLRTFGGRVLNAALSLRPRLDLPTQPGDLGSVGLDVEAEHASDAEMLETLNAAAWKRGRFLLLTIDEIQSGDPTVLREIVRVAHATHGTNTPMVLVAAGLPETPTFIKQKVRTYTERFDYFDLGLLSPEDAKEARVGPLREQGVGIDPAAVDLLVDASGGYPDYVQRYASAAWLHRRGDVITVDDANATIPGVAKRIDVIFYAGLLNSLAPREKAYVLALADLGPGAHTVGEVAERLGALSSAYSSTCAHLLKKEVIISPSPAFVEFRLPLTERYVQQHRAEFERASRARRVTRTDIVLHGVREDVIVTGTFEGVKKHGAGEIALLRSGDEYHGFRDVHAFESVETGDEIRVRQRSDGAGTQVEMTGADAEGRERITDAEQRDDGFEL